MSSHNTPKESTIASESQSNASDLLINIDYCATNEKISFEIVRPEMEQNSILKHDILLGRNRNKFKNTAEINKFLATLTDPRLKNIKLDGQKSKDEIELRATHNHFFTPTNHINELPERDVTVKPKDKRSHTVVQSLSQENDTIDHFYETLFDVNTPKKYKKLKNRMLKRVKSDTNIALRYQYLRKTERERSRKVRNEYWQQKHREKKDHASVNTKTRGESSNYTERLEHNRTQFEIILSPRNGSPNGKSPNRDKSKSPSSSPTRNRQIIVKSNTLGVVKPIMKTVGQQTKITTLRDKDIISAVAIESSDEMLKHDLKNENENSLNLNIKMFNEPINKNLTITKKQSKHNLETVNQDLKILTKPTDEEIKLTAKKSQQDLKSLPKQSIQHLSISLYDCVDIKSSNSNTNTCIRTSIKPTIPRRPRNESPPPILSRYTSPQRYEDKRPQIPRRFINDKSQKPESKIIDDNDLLKMKISDCLNTNSDEQTLEQSNKQIENLCQYFKKLLEETVKTHLNPDTKNDEYNIIASPTYRYARKKTKTETATNENDLKRKLDLFSNYSAPYSSNITKNVTLPKKCLKRTTSATTSKMYQCSFDEHVFIEKEEVGFFATQNNKPEPQTNTIIDGTGKVVMKQVVIDDLDKVHMYGSINALQYVKQKKQEGNVGSSVRFNSQVDILDDQNNHNIGHLGNSIHVHNLILPVANKMQRSFTSPNKKDFYKNTNKSASVNSVARISNKQLSKSSINLNSTTVTLSNIQKTVAVRSNPTASYDNSSVLFTKSEYMGDTCFKRRYNYYRLLKSKMAQRALRPAKDMRPNAKEVKQICSRSTALACPLECLNSACKKKYTSQHLSIFAESYNNKKIITNTRKPSRNTFANTKDLLAGSFKSTGDHTRLPRSHKEASTAQHLTNTRPNPKKYIPKCKYEDKPINVHGYKKPEPQNIKNRYCAINKLQKVLPKTQSPVYNKKTVENKVIVKPNINIKTKTSTLANRLVEDKIKVERKPTKLQSENIKRSEIPRRVKPAYITTQNKTATQCDTSKSIDTLIGEIFGNMSKNVVPAEKVAAEESPRKKPNKLMPEETSPDGNDTVHVGFTPSEKIENKLKVVLPISGPSNKPNSSSEETPFSSTTSFISLNRKNKSSMSNTVIDNLPVVVKNGTNTEPKQNKVLNVPKPVNTEAADIVNTLIEFVNNTSKAQKIDSTKTNNVPKQTVKKSGIPVALNRPKPLLLNKTNEPKMLSNIGKAKSCLNKESYKSKTIESLELKKNTVKTESKNLEPNVSKARKQIPENKIKHNLRQNSFVTSNKIKPTLTTFIANRNESYLANKNSCKTTFDRQKSLPWAFNMKTIEENNKIFAKPKSSITDLTRIGSYKKDSNLPNKNQCKTTSNFNRQKSLPEAFGIKKIEENKIFAKPKSSITDLIRYGSHLQRTPSIPPQNKRVTSPRDRYFSIKPVQIAKKSIVAKEEAVNKKSNINATYSQIHARKTDTSPNNRATVNTNNKTIIDKKLEDKQNKIPILKSPRASSVSKQNIMQKEIAIPNKSKTATQSNKKPSNEKQLCVQKEDKSNIYIPVTKKSSSSIDKSSSGEQLNEKTNQRNTLRLLESLTIDDEEQSWILGKGDILPVNFVLLDYKNPLDVTRYAMNKITKELCEPLGNISEIVKEAPTRRPKLRSVHTIPASIRKYFNFKSKKSKEKISDVNTGI